MSETTSTPEPSRFLAAAIQMRAGLDKSANLARADELITQAAGQGASLVVLPEMFLSWGPLEAVIRQAEPIPGPDAQALADLARRHRVMLLAGSIAERDPAESRAFNTSLLFAPDGTLLSRYRKLHRFDVNLPGQIVSRESDWIAPGSDTVVVSTPLGRLGLAICYDLRFPELFRRLTDDGYDILLLPSAFSAATGRDHWDVLLSARAIENQCYLIAANQCGTGAAKFPTHGHSQIIDPWGIALAQGGDEETVVLAEIDRARIAEVRRRLPMRAHRRLSGS